MNEKEILRQECLKKHDELMVTIEGLPEEKGKLREDFQAVRALMEKYHQIPEPTEDREELRMEFLSERFRIAHIPTLQRTDEDIQNLHDVIGRYLAVMHISPLQAYSDQRERKTTE